MWSQAGLLVLGMSIGMAPSFLVLSLLKFAVGFVQQVTPAVVLVILRLLSVRLFLCA